MSMDIDPTFLETCKAFFKETPTKPEEKKLSMIEESERPLIDISRLTFGNFERDKCIKEMGEAASQWGFFQVVNHGIPQEVLKRIKCEQMKVFHKPFDRKSKEKFLNLSANSYRWGNPKATCLRQLSWSEAFHISISDISRMSEHESLRSFIQTFVATTASLARSFAEILAQYLGIRSTTNFDKICGPYTSYLRMNRYPPCPISSEVYGLVPYTDTDFLTILYQDTIGGLQLMKDGRWVSVRPNPGALIINIGDLFQVFSNGVYRSIEHRVVAPCSVERLSMAYFYCPSHDAVIESGMKPAKYRKFSFREYKEQIQMDIDATGDKVGLSRFLNF